MAQQSYNAGNPIGGPARKCFVAAKHDVNALAVYPKAIRAPAAGIITLRAIGDAADVAHPVLAGEILNLQISHIRATGTTVVGDIIGYA